MIPFLMLAAAVVSGAPECHPLKGDRILGSDLAAALPAFSGLPSDLTVGLAPRPGVRRTLAPPELLRIARENHIDMEDAGSVCFERSTAIPSIEAAISAMRDALGVPDARVEIVDLSKFPAPEGPLIFPRAWLSEPRSGDTAVWNGYVQYEGGRFPVSARVRVGVKRPRVVASVNLTPGVPIKDGDVQLDNEFGFPGRAPALTSLADVVGSIPKRLISAGQMITALAVMAPNDVSKGETVVVEVRSGAAVVKLEAKAESAGRRGEMVTVRNASSGKVFRAKVEQKGRVALDCTPESSK